MSGALLVITFTVLVICTLCYFVLANGKIDTHGTEEIDWWIPIEDEFGDDSE